MPAWFYTLEFWESYSLTFLCFLLVFLIVRRGIERDEEMCNHVIQCDHCRPIYNQWTWKEWSRILKNIKKLVHRCQNSPWYRPSLFEKFHTFCVDGLKAYETGDVKGLAWIFCKSPGVGMFVAIMFVVFLLTDGKE